MNWKVLLNQFVGKRVDIYLKRTVLKNVEIKQINLDQETGELMELVYMEDGEPGYLTLKSDELINFKGISQRCRND